MSRALWNTRPIEDALRAENERYKLALEYYADKTHYTWGAPHKKDNDRDWDMGEVAQSALNGGKNV
jgi:hypothetical protein